MALLARQGIVGVVHLEPLPGTVRHTLALPRIVELALRDAGALADGGCDAVVVENFGDAPFAKRVGPETIAAMTVATEAVARSVRVPVGVNVLRNDAPAAIAVAHAAGARFVRCNVWAGVAWADQGVLEGCARESLELKRRLGAEVEVWADAHVKHAAHPGPLEQSVTDNERNLCDAHIVTGPRTGAAAAPDDLVRALAVATRPVLVGSGLTAKNLPDYRAAAGFIVGSDVKRDGRVDAKRVREFVAARDDLR